MLRFLTEHFSLAHRPHSHIYTLPGKKPLRPKGCDTPFINKAWLDRLGMEMPTTVDEWYEVLKAFKEQGANGNGDPNDEIPLTGSAKTNLTGSATSTPGSNSPHVAIIQEELVRSLLNINHILMIY